MKNFIISIIMLATVAASANTKVARVVISEAGAECSTLERFYVATVIKNRIGHKGFNRGKHKTMLDVINQKNAFECINHSNNWNWKASGDPTSVKSEAWQKAWFQAKNFSKGKFSPKHDDIVFFVTKGFKIPSNYVSKKYWTLHKKFSTKHFDFYSITEKE